MERKRQKKKKGAKKEKAKKAAKKPKVKTVRKKKAKKVAKKNEEEKIYLKNFLEVRKDEKHPSEFGVYKGRPQELVIIYSEFIIESIMMRIEESLATDPQMLKPYFD